MIERILILEPDQVFAERLRASLEQVGKFTVAILPTVKEACLQLVQRPSDLAFIPIDEGAKIIRSLRAVQPDLRLVLVTPKTDVEIPRTYAGKVQGVLIKALLDVELPMILQVAANQPVLSDDTSPDRPDTAVLFSTLHQANLDRLIRTAVFMQGTNLLAYSGELTESEARSIALQTGPQETAEQAVSRLQFTHLPARAGDYLLYSQSVSDEGYWLTLVALPETPISELRYQAKRLARKLASVVAGRVPSQTGLLIAPTGGLDGRRTSYAIVWRASEPLPSYIHIPLRRAIQRLAVANACVITHIRVQADMVHLVVTCPPGRDSAWAAYLFKSGSEQTIQQEYGVLAQLWDTGYYAVESGDPLSAVELNLFLESRPFSPS